MLRSGVEARCDDQEPPAYVGRFPEATAKELRKLLLKSLADAGGLSRVQAGQLLGMAPSTASDAARAPEPEPDDSMPPEVPPGFPAPAPRKAPAFVLLSARLVDRLKRDYGPGVATDDGRRLGDLAEVAEWIGSLKSGKLRPGRAG